MRDEPNEPSCAQCGDTGKPPGAESVIADLRAELAEAKREIEVLRQYGNKDCTAMADAALKDTP
jgi:hypothetical protein